jgi:hypothetical protein
MINFENPLPLLEFYGNHIFGEKIDVYLVTAVLTLILHSFTILFLTNRYSAFISKSTDAWRVKVSYLVYTLTVLVIMLTHLMDLLYFSYVIDCMHVFSDRLTSFYFAGEMYTTLGYGSYSLPPELRGLPFVIGFTGLFAASISGAGMYSMLQELARVRQSRSANNQSTS